MEQQLRRNLHLLVEQIALAQGLPSTEAANFINKYIAEIHLPIQGGSEEVVKIRRGSGGDITLATSLKIPNLRFQFGELLLEIYRTVVLTKASPEQPYRQILIGIDFLRRIRKLSGVDISTRQAKLLLAIYQLAQTEKRVTVGMVTELLKVDPDNGAVAADLSALERLGCIRLTMRQITLCETIEVVRQE